VDTSTGVPKEISAEVLLAGVGTAVGGNDDRLSVAELRALEEAQRKEKGGGLMKKLGFGRKSTSLSGVTPIDFSASGSSSPATGSSFGATPATRDSASSESGAGLGQTALVADVRTAPVSTSPPLEGAHSGSPAEATSSFAPPGTSETQP
jgi:hypothetical protein